ncbi:alpha/beta fold hydrolase [Streptomyces violaceusniger]|uniref:alpha/beta fold hydrolase n=1 Tax=Streptomyces violaceusniger TaxID=68280 RepID=UPI0001E4E3D6|nr:hypothetical protein [Streptomyces violaceusniger]
MRSRVQGRSPGRGLGRSPSFGKGRVGEQPAAGVKPGAIDQVELVGRVDVREDLGRIRVPTLVISTTLDTMATPYHHRQVADAIPGARFAELESGHLPFVEAPDEWLGLIRTFLDAQYAQYAQYAQA